MFTYHFFQLTTQSYTHVGQGAADSGVIDNLIQREKPYDIPVMHASSLKGAFREHCKCILDYPDVTLNYLFGSGESESAGPNAKTSARKVYQAIVNIHDARLLMLPVGALFGKSFYYATSNFVLSRYNKILKQLTGKELVHNLPLPSENERFFCLHSNPPQLNPLIEGIQGNYKLYQGNSIPNKILSTPIESIAIFHDDLFVSLCRNCIPIIERNKLDEGGISENKFNEEVLPYDTKFWFFVSFPTSLKDDTIIKTFIEDIKKSYVQIGANYSLGQGLCEISEITP